MADSLLERYRADTRRAGRARSACRCGAPAPMRTAGDDVAEVLALLGVRPVWDEASRRVTGLEPIPLAELGRPAHRRHRPDQRLLPRRVPARGDHARRRGHGWSPGLDEPAERQLRPRPRRTPTWPTHGDERRATTRIFGSKPGRLRGRAAAADRQPQLARRRRPGRGVRGVGRLRLRPRTSTASHARPDMETAYRRIAVAAKNVDTREHDIADSDDYFQYHGGMIATVRALTGKAPAAYIGDSHPARRRPHPHAVGGDRAGLPRPGGQPAAGSPRCAGTATRAPSSSPRPSTTCSATTPPPAWSPTGCTRSSPQTYVLDPENREFLERVEPVGAARHRRAAAGGGRPGHVGAPRPARSCAALQEVYLETEGDLEDDTSR